MPPAVPISFENEDGENDAGALQSACKQLEKLEWEDADVKFFFNQAEIKMTSAGVKKQFTKLQALTTCLPQKVINQVKPLLRKTEDEFTNNDAYKQIKQ